MSILRASISVGNSFLLAGEDENGIQYIHPSNVVNALQDTTEPQHVGNNVKFFLHSFFIPISPRSIQIHLHRHLARNPFVCDCSLRWLADYLHKNPIETSGAKCEGPKKMHRKKIEAIREEKLKCK